MRTYIKLYSWCCWAAFLLFSIMGCKASDSQSEHSSETPLAVSTPDSIAQEEEELAFPSPEIPMTIQDAKERALYYVRHFWDNCDFNNPILLEHPSRMEQSLVNFFGVATYFPIPEVEQSLLLPFEKAQDSLFVFFTKHYEKYLFEPNSPFFNEELYLPVVNWLARSPKVDLATQERAKFRAKLMQRNRVGHLAEDFAFTVPSGEVHRLSSFRGKPTILFFYTPGCSSCRNALAELKGDEALLGMILTGRVNALFIDSESDSEEWQRSIEELPEWGVIGFNHDGKVTSVPLYDLKASPTIYLIDSSGKVQLKDKTLAQLREVLLDE